jgi:thioesterase domain-containing protein
MTQISPGGAAPAESERGDNALVVISAGGPKPALVCVHGESGHLRLFFNLAQHLDPAQPVYGLRGVVQDGPAPPPYRTFEEMAHRYVLELRELEHSGPYLVLGECNGAELAYELAQQLDANGKDVALLALVDSFGPGEPRLVISGRVYRHLNSLRMLAFHLSAVTRIDAGHRRAYVATRLRRVLGRLRTRASSHGRPPPGELLRQRAYREAGRAYRPTPYAGRVALFRGASLPWGARTGRDLGWDRLAADLETTELSAYFGTCMLEPVVGRLAEALERAVAPSTPADSNLRSSPGG